MCTDKTDNHPTRKENYDSNNPIVITFNIEYIPAIANVIRRKKIIFQIRMILPVSGFTCFYPFLDWFIRINMFTNKLL